MVDGPPLPRPSTVITPPKRILFVNVVNDVLPAISIDSNQLPNHRVTSRTIISGLDCVTLQLDRISIDFNRDCD